MTHDVVFDGDVDVDTVLDLAPRRWVDVEVDHGLNVHGHVNPYTRVEVKDHLDVDVDRPS